MASVALGEGNAVAVLKAGAVEGLVQDHLDGALDAESLDQMVARVDILSINCPHTPATYHLLSARRLALLKPSAYIVNTARGEVIDENALARMIDNNELAGAGLDVFEAEPRIPDALKRMENVVLTPHVGSATMTTRRRMAAMAVDNLLAGLEGGVPPNWVNAEMM